MRARRALPLVLLAAAACALADRADRWRDPKPAAPDLSVRFIERTPRYPGLKLEYRRIDEPNGNKGDGLPARVVNASEQHGPMSGQWVTFIAHVRNAGAAVAPRYDWHWLLDGRDVRGGWSEPLAPGAERAYRWRWRWVAGRHHIGFEVNRGRLFGEVTRKNNSVADATDALSFHFFVDPRVYAWFAGVRNGLDSYSWDDWAQFQVREMNREFRDEIHPATPAGIVVRLRLDRVTLLPDDYRDPGGTHAPEDNVTGGNDGVWGFTNELLRPNAQGKAFYEANPQWLLGPEWPLHHELGHQLGQPDYYLLPVSGERNGALPGVPYEPAAWFRDQMMYAGNYAHDEAIGKGKGTWDSGYRFWGEHAARALNRDAHLRRGFFGTFLVDVPARNRFVIVDERGRPIPNAGVAMHVAISREYGNARFDARPDFTGRTGPDGAWTLQRSPWRVILNWTSNGAVQLVVHPRGGPARVGFLNITDFNLAYWRGHRDLASYDVVARTVEGARSRRP
ncbi:MAG: hypothetical protein IT208_04135 [Chthonomonadales bacterium]|nr:hypothetical protein [Chthonomonadales bacterium]